MSNTIKSENWDGVTAPAIPAGWGNNFANSALATTATGSLSASNSVVPLFTGGQAQNAAIWNVAASTANVRVSSYFKADASPAAQINFQMFARFGPTATTAYGSGTGYFATVVLNGGGNTGIFLFSAVSGSFSVVAGPSFPSAFAGANWYYWQLDCQGSSIRIRVQRQSDSKWLDNTGTWVTDATDSTYCITATDTAVAGSGYAGLGFYSPAFGSIGTTVRFDDFLFENLGGPLAAGSTYAAVASSTSITVSGTRAIGGAAPYSYQFQRSPDNSTWTNIGSAQTGLDPSTDPSPYTDTGRTTGTSYYYRTETVDSAGPAVTVHTPSVQMTPRASATTYYISSSGSDAANGTTTGTPWQTIARANAQGGMLGDTFLFHGGDTFSGSLVLQGIAGTYQHPITVGSYGTGRSTISCSNSWGVRFAKCSGVILKDIIVTGSGVSSGGSTTSTCAAVDIVNPNLSGTLQQVWVDNVEVSGTYSGIEVWGVGLTTATTGSGFKDVRVTNCKAHEIAYCGVFVRTFPLLDQDGLQFPWWNYNRPAVIGSTSNNYNIFKGTVNQYVYVANCEIYHSYGDPLRTDPVHSGDGIMVKSGQDCLVERCLVRDSGQNGYGPAGNWMQEVTRGVIRFCETYNFHTRVDGVDGDGFDLDGGCVDCIMEYCYSHDNDGAGYLCGPYTGGAAPVRCTMRYCISENDGRRGLYAIFPYSSADLTVHNCLIYSTPAAAGTTGGILDGGTNNVKLYNNIFLTTGGVRFVSGTTSGWPLVGNLYWPVSGSFALNYASTTYTSFASFVSGTGQETLNGSTVGLNVDPLLSSVGGGSAQLPTHQVASLTAYDQSSSSPTIDAGLDLLVVYGIDTGPIDFHGYPNRDGTTTAVSGFDIGPTKYNAGSLLPSTGGGGGGGGAGGPVIGCGFIRGTGISS